MGIKDTVSQPNGGRVWAIIAMSSLAWILSISATGQCTFMKRVVEYTLSSGEEKNMLFHEGRGVGFWGWSYGGQCYNYAIGGKQPDFDILYGASKAFTGVADAVGGIGMVASWYTSCFPADKAKFRILAVVFIVVSFFEMLSLILFASSLCNDAAFFKYGLAAGETIPDTSDDRVTSSCSMGPGSALAATSSVFWFLAGIASRLVRPPKGDDMGTIASMEGLNDTTEENVMTPARSSRSIGEDDPLDDDDDEDEDEDDDGWE